MAALVREGFAVDMAAGDFFEEVEAHHHQEIFCISVEESLVMRHVFMIGFGQLLLESHSVGIGICFSDCFPVVFCNRQAQLLFFQN